MPDTPDWTSSIGYNSDILFGLTTFPNNTQIDVVTGNYAAIMVLIAALGVHDKQSVQIVQSPQASVGVSNGAELITQYLSGTDPNGLLAMQVAIPVLGQSARVYNNGPSTQIECVGTTRLFPKPVNLGDNLVTRNLTKSAAMVAATPIQIQDSSGVANTTNFNGLVAVEASANIAGVVQCVYIDALGTERVRDVLSLVANTATQTLQHHPIGYCWWQFNPSVTNGAGFVTMNIGPAD